MLKTIAATLLSFSLLAPASAQQSSSPPDGQAEPAIPAPDLKLLPELHPGVSDCLRNANGERVNCDPDMFRTPVYKPAEPPKPCVPTDPDGDQTACLYLLEKSPRPL